MRALSSVVLRNAASSVHRSYNQTEMSIGETKTFDLTVDETEEEVALRIQGDVERGLEHLGRQQFDPAIAAFKLALANSPNTSPVRDVVTHNLLTAYKGRVNELLAAGEPLHVNRYVPEMSALDLKTSMRSDTGFRRQFADQLRNLALDFYNHRQHEPALFFIRKALGIERCPSYYVELTNALAWTKQPARLSDYTGDYSEKDLGRHIFLACAPKSGSTFLKNVLQSVTGFKPMFSVFAALQNEQEMDLPNLVRFGNQNTVTQQHARASEANIQMMQAFGVRPVVLVRNIFDSVASLLDFYTGGYVFSTYFEKDDFLALSRDEKVDLLIRFVIPWYFQFVASWQKAEREGRLEMLWLTYEEMVSDKPGTVRRILDLYDVRLSEGVLEAKIADIEGEKDKNRFNKGKTGRGSDVLTNAERDRITSLARYFPKADFRPFGVEFNA